MCNQQETMYDSLNILKCTRRSENILAYTTKNYSQEKLHKTNKSLKLDLIYIQSSKANITII